jgi:NADH-quinone oxidoreductase subunit L
MSGMGGLRRSMPLTFVVTTIGLAALAGIPPFAGFSSKESILGAALDAAGSGSVGGWLVLVSGAITVVVTGAYVTRLWLRTFFGAPAAGAPHDPPAAMRWPLLALALPSALLGFVALVRGSGSLGRGVPGPGLAPQLGTAVLSVLLTGAGVLAAWLVWRRDPARDPALALRRLRPVLGNAFYLDAVQRALVVRPALALARVVRRADESVVDGAVEGTASGASGLGGLLSRAHAGGLGRYATAVLTGALLIAAAAVVTGGVRG